jgi:hypothetical protein
LLSWNWSAIEQDHRIGTALPVLSWNRKREREIVSWDIFMTDSVDDNQIHMQKPNTPSKYGRCSHCGMYSMNMGVCPFCGKGEVR